MIRCVALLRGVNVGKAKRVPMAELRALAEGLGYGEVRTLLNSGNLIFEVGDDVHATDHADRLETGVLETLGVRSKIAVLTAAELAAVIENNPFQAEAAEAPARLLVSVFRDGPAAQARIATLAGRDWAPEQLAATAAAAYSWHPHGLSAGRLAEALDRAAGDAVTGRNWSTLLKLQALLSRP